MTTFFSILLALALLGIMITVHELGHFCAARACGIAVRAFGIGFGPVLLRRTGKKSGTEYTLRLIPCGGFCAFYGEDDAKEKAKDDPRSMLLQPAWKRLIMIAAGPVMNFVLAFVVALGFFAGYGLPYAGDKIDTVVAEVTAGSPADEAGMLVNDVILSVNGENVNGDLSELMAKHASDGAPLPMNVLRGGETKTLLVQPEFVQSENRYMIGITMTLQYDTVWVRGGLGKTISHTWDICVDAGTAILGALGKLVTSGEGADQLSGPVGVISIIAQQTRAYKLMGYLNMLVVISINLGLVNLLPIPGLDGCRVIFTVIEMIFRRPVNRKVEAYVHMAGYLFLFSLMILFTFRDILNLFK